MYLRKSIFVLNFLLSSIYLFADNSIKDTVKNNLTDTIADLSIPDYSEIFKYDYPKALKLFKENIDLFDSICNKYKIDPALAVSIVFPEFIRYSIYKDALETLSLEVVYVNLGSNYADFSIGLMQMKPSFAEKIENYLRTNPKLFKKYRKINLYASQNEKEIRTERLERLKNIEWQIIYLTAFYDIVSERFSSIKFISKEEKIKFFSAAYNSDFSATENKICEQIKKRYFPNGRNGMAPQYSYSQVSADFYRNYYIKVH